MFEQRLRATRKANKLTQEQLAKLLKTTKGTISNYENGYSTPSNEMLASIAEVLNVSSDYLLGISDNPTPSETNLIDITNNFEFVIPKGTIFISNLYLDEIVTEDTLTVSDFLKKYEKYIHINNFTSLLYIKNKNRISIVTKAGKKGAPVEEIYKISKEEKDIAKRLEEFKKEIENSDGLAFSGEPLSDEAKESLIESMEHIFRQTQRINKKYTPKRFRDEE